MCNSENLNKETAANKIKEEEEDGCLKIAVTQVNYTIYKLKL
jgi:hypothetical protein